MLATYGKLVRKHNLPILFGLSFFVGSACELIMVKFNVGGINFYSTVIDKETKKAALKIIEKEQKGLF